MINYCRDVIRSDVSFSKKEYRAGSLPCGGILSTFHCMRRCMILMAAGFTCVPLVSTRSRSGSVAGSLPRWAGSGISERRMAGMRARSLRFGSRRVLMFENEFQTRLRRSRLSGLLVRPGREQGVRFYPSFTPFVLRFLR
jgi:hypothetical protein